MSTHPTATSAIDQNVLDRVEPAENWAADTQTALKGTSATDNYVPSSGLNSGVGAVPSSTVPGESATVIPPTEHLDTNAKSQAQVDKVLGTSSAVSTPGHELPGAWTDKPADNVVNALASVGSAAYNAIPDSVKGAFSSGPTATSNSPITTTTNTHAGPTTTESLSNTASNAASTASTTATDAANTAYVAAAGLAATAVASAGAAVETAKDTYNSYAVSSTAGPMKYGGTLVPSEEDGKVHPRPVAGATSAPVGDNANSATLHSTATLPSHEPTGAMPIDGPIGGVGALPGNLGEEGVAVLPEERENPNPLAATTDFVGAKTNTAIASPYNSASPYSDVNANSVSPPHNSNIASKVADDVGAHKTADKLESKPTETTGPSTTEKIKEKVVPSKTHSDSTPPSDSASKPAPPLDTSTPVHDTSSNDASSADSPSKKVGFMQKLKGEAKILSGKMGKNEDKIAQGQALKTGA